MSDLRPVGTAAVYDGEEIRLLFTLNAIDEIQTRCNMPLNDAVKCVVDFIDRDYKENTVDIYRKVATILINEGREEQISEMEVGKKLAIGDGFAWKILQAYGISLPESDDEDDEDDEKNVRTGQ